MDKIMRIGVPKERLTNETRVAVTPKTVKQLLKMGFTVVVENDAGKLANFYDEAYVQAGATISKVSEVWKSDIILKVNAPKESEILLLDTGKILISFIWADKNLELLKKLAERGTTVLAMDSVPRISRAQSLDALSSMANIAGYRAVIEASHQFSRFFSGQITAAGKIPPAEVMVIGAGVAGLSAISMAHRLGAIVRAFDVRQEVKEQIQSVGAKFLELKFNKESSSNNYMKTASETFSEAFIKAEMELFSINAKEVDVIITTAVIPGESAKKLITKEMVYSMKSGSVIVDLAAKNGGNCECTVADEIVVTTNGVKIIGYTDLPVRLPTQSSELYSRNLVNLLKFLCKEKNGIITIDYNDMIIRSIVVVRNGEITYPTPSIPISNQQALTKEETLPDQKKPEKIVSPWKKYTMMMLIIVLFFCLGDAAPKELLNHFTIFSLSCIIGYYVVWNVPYSLHTPLMSITNAISGIIIIGALLQIGYGSFFSLLSFIAILIASINIFGGFAITHRVLKMFIKDEG